VYWLHRPPYLRWAAAAVLLLGAVAWDLRGSPRQIHPFVTTAIAAGSPVPPEAIEWREIPSGLLGEPALDGTVAAVDLIPGDPLTDSVVTRGVAIPEGWWAVPVAIGRHAQPGDDVMLVTIDPTLTVGGVVVESESGDVYSLDFQPAVVAVPEEYAPLIAAASAERRVVAVVKP
jgi:hypothetical protein